MRRIRSICETSLEEAEGKSKNSKRRQTTLSYHMPQTAKHPFRKKLEPHHFLSLTHTPHTCQDCNPIWHKMCSGYGHTYVIQLKNGTAERVPRPPPRGRTTSSSIRKPKDALVGCDEEPRMCPKVYLIVANACGKYTANKLTGVNVWRACFKVMDFTFVVVRQAAGPPSQKMKRYISCHIPWSKIKFRTGAASAEGRRDEAGHLIFSSLVPQATQKIITCDERAYVDKLHRERGVFYYCGTGCYNMVEYRHTRYQKHHCGEEVWVCPMWVCLDRVTYGS